MFKKKMFSAALACGLCVALSMPAYGAEVRGDITSDIVYDGQDWVYVENGQVNNSYTGVRQNDNGWWRVEAGKVNFGYNGLAENEYGWWVIKDGKLDFDCNGLIEDEKGWFYIKDGMVDWSYTGLASNEAGWFLSLIHISEPTRH